MSIEKKVREIILDIIQRWVGENELEISAAADVKLALSLLTSPDLVIMEREQAKEMTNTISIYGKHLFDCLINRKDIVMAERRCNCGFLKALKSLDGKE